MNVFYDITRFPDLSTFRLLPLNMIYLKQGENINQIAKDARTKNFPVCLEIEDTTLDSSGVASTLRTMKQEEPNLSVGVCGMAPYASWSMSLMTNKPDTFEWWRSTNDRQAEIAINADCLYPGVYMLSPDIEAWKGSFHAIKKESERYKKPIRYLVCPTIEPVGEEFIPIVVWSEMLDVLNYYQSEIVIWQHGFQHDRFSEVSEWFVKLLSHV